MDDAYFRFGATWRPASCAPPTSPPWLLALPVGATSVTPPSTLSSSLELCNAVVMVVVHHRYPDDKNFHHHFAAPRNTGGPCRHLSHCDTPQRRSQSTAESMTRTFVATPRHPRCRCCRRRRRQLWTPRDPTIASQLWTPNVIDKPQCRSKEDITNKCTRRLKWPCSPQSHQ